MALATSNNQGEISPLEIGLHALRRGKGDKWSGPKGKRYAELVGRNETDISLAKAAAQVYVAVGDEIKFAYANLRTAAPSAPPFIRCDGITSPPLESSPVRHQLRAAPAAEPRVACSQLATCRKPPHRNRLRHASGSRESSITSPLAAAAPLQATFHPIWLSDPALQRCILRRF